MPAWIPPLIPIDPIDMQSVEATARPRRVQFQSKVVPADEPIERALRLLVPPRIGCRPVRFQAGRHHGLCLDRLLIEVGARAGRAGKNPLLPIGRKWPFSEVCKCTSHRRVSMPRSKTAFCPVSAPGENQGVREFRIVRNSTLLEPRPIGFGGPVVQIHQARRECFAGLVHEAVRHSIGAGIRAYRSG